MQRSISILGHELERRGFEPLQPYAFYREIFPDGELDDEDASPRANTRQSPWR